MIGQAANARSAAGRIWRMSRANDSAVLYTLASRGWSVVFGVLLIAIAAKVLSPETQGYFFTFLSLLTVQIVVELGFGAMLTRFVSHEWAELDRSATGVVVGAPAALDRLASLMRLSLRWYAGAIAGVSLTLAIVGTALFSAKGSGDVAWQAPWLALCASQGAMVLCSALASALEGSDRVAVSQRSALRANVGAGTIASLALLAGAGLWALPVLASVRAVLILVQLHGHAMPMLALRHRPRTTHHISWRTDFWPQQWRLAISLVAFLLAYSCFTPITFAVSGPLLAAEVGVLAQIFNVTNQVGYSWLTAAQTDLGRYAAGGDFAAMRRLVVRTRRLSMLTVAGLGVACLVAVSAIKLAFPSYGERFGPLSALTAFLLAALVLQNPNTDILAVRFRKREPFAMLSVVTLLLTATSTAALGTVAGADGVALGFLGVVALFVVPFARRAYRTYLPPGPKEAATTRLPRGDPRQRT